MKQYRVVRDCFYKRYWSAGQIAEFEDDAVVPYHFELIGVEAPRFVPPPVQEVEKPVAFSQVIGQGPQITTGMGAGLEDNKPVDAVEAIKKRGRPVKK